MGPDRGEPQVEGAAEREAAGAAARAQNAGPGAAPRSDVGRDAGLASGLDGLASAATALRAPPRRGAGPARRSAVMRMQRSAGNRATARVLARDWALATTVPNPPPVALTAHATATARWINRVMFHDAAELGVIRDVLGIAAQPAAVDDDFISAVARYQSNYGLTVDGILGPHTSAQLSREITSEQTSLAAGPDKTALRRVARRLHLRALVTRVHGVLVHQGFVGPDNNPDGCVSVRTADDGNSITLEYTGENSDSVNWLQFIGGDLSATPPGAGAPVLQVGTQPTSGGAVAWSTAAATNWSVDTIPSTPPAAPQPLYDVTSAHFRTAGRSIAMLDTPGGASWVGVAQAFTAPGAGAAGATQARLRLRFSTYVVRGNVARYRVDYVATTMINTTTGTASAISYAVSGGRAVNGLAAEHHTALTTGYPGNPIH